MECRKLPNGLVLHRKYVSCWVEELDHRADHFKNQSLFAPRLFLEFLLEFLEGGCLLLTIYVEARKHRWFVVGKHIHTHRLVLDLHLVFKLALGPKRGHGVTDKSRGVGAWHFV